MRNPRRGVIVAPFLLTSRASIGMRSTTRNPGLFALISFTNTLNFTNIQLRREEGGVQSGNGKAEVP